MRLAFRQLLNRPGFTTVAVLTLALGLGAAAVVACYVPARRAARIAPMVALGD